MQNPVPAAQCNTQNWLSIDKMAPPSGVISGIYDKNDQSLGSGAFQLPLLSSPLGSFSDEGVPVVSTPPEPDKPLETRIVELPSHASSGWNEEPSCKSHDDAICSISKPKSKFAFGGGNAVAPEPPSNFNKQERERREKNYKRSASRKNSFIIEGGSNFGEIPVSLKATRLFLSHCWRNVAMKPRKEVMFSHLTERVRIPSTPLLLYAPPHRRYDC